MLKKLTVPEHISYGLLTDVLRRLMQRGNGIIYLSKVIEYMDSILRQFPEISFDELVKRAAEQLETEDNVWVVLNKRKM